MEYSGNFYEGSCQLVEEVFSKYWKKYLETPKKIKKLQILRNIIEELSWGLLELAGYDFSFRRTPLEEISEKIGIIARGRLMMPMQFAGIGFTVGTGGSGLSANSYITPLQGDFTAGLIFRLGN